MQLTSLFEHRTGMPHHCAACPERYDRRSGGQVYCIALGKARQQFWLCGKCATHLEIKTVGGEVIIAPKKLKCSSLRAA
jgi:hypothetical protein